MNSFLQALGIASVNAHGVIHLVQDAEWYVTHLMFFNFGRENWLTEVLMLRLTGYQCARYHCGLFHRHFAVCYPPQTVGFAVYVSMMSLS